MDVVYNASYGRASLSKDAVKFLANLGYPGPRVWIQTFSDTWVEPTIEEICLQRHTEGVVQCVKSLGDRANGIESHFCITSSEYPYTISNRDGYEVVRAGKSNREIWKA